MSDEIIKVWLMLDSKGTIVGVRYSEEEAHKALSEGVAMYANEVSVCRYSRPSQERVMTSPNDTDDERARLLARIAELEKDGARLDAIESLRLTFAIPMRGLQDEQWGCYGFDRKAIFYGRTVRDAIDAAIAESARDLRAEDGK